MMEDTGHVGGFLETRRAVLVTAIRTEYSAVREHLKSVSEFTHPQGTVYEVGYYAPANADPWSVAIVEAGVGNQHAAVETERAARVFDPAVLMFVGIAGGLKDVAIGDVVVATKVYGYEAGKAKNRFEPRPSVAESSYALVQRAQAEARRNDWTQGLRESPDIQGPQVHIGPIAAGEKVVASRRSSVFKFLRQQYGDALAVEMEGRGFLQAAQANPGVSALIVRGVSDLVAAKSAADAKGFQAVAARHASAFAFAVLAKLRNPKQNVGEFVVGLRVDIGTFTEARAREIVAQLRGITGDVTLNLKRVEKGSVRLVVEGARQAFQLLASLAVSGQLSLKLGIEVIGVTWTGERDETTKRTEEGRTIRSESQREAAVVDHSGLPTWRQRYRPDWNLLQLVETDLRGAKLSALDLAGADLRRASLAGADLSNSLLRAVQFSDADLRGADLSNAQLDDADFVNANLSSANLTNAVMRGTRLAGTNLDGALLNGTLFSNVDLSHTYGLASCRHLGASIVDFSTLLRSGSLPIAFLRGSGLSDRLIDYLPSLVDPNPIEFYSCFISYATADQNFADRLFADLQGRGVRCWFAPHDLQPGGKLHEQIDEAIRVYDRLLLVLSSDSMKSSWVHNEIAKARRKEIQQGRRVLFPISLVPFAELHSWQQFDADLGEDTAQVIREYFLPDFSNWKDHAAYTQAFDRLVASLKAS